MVSVTLLAVPAPCLGCRDGVTRRLAALPVLLSAEEQCIRVVGDIPAEDLTAVARLGPGRAIECRVISVHPLWSVTTHAKCSRPVRNTAIALLMVGEQIARRAQHAQASLMDAWIHHVMPYMISLSPLYANAGAGNGIETSSAAQRERAHAHTVDLVHPLGPSCFRMSWPPPGCGCACCLASAHEPRTVTRGEATRGIVFAPGNGCDIVRFAGCCTHHAATLPLIPVGRYQVFANLYIGGNYFRCPSAFRFSDGFVCHDCSSSGRGRTERSCKLLIAKESGDTDCRATPTPIDGVVLLGEFDVVDDLKGLTVEWTTHRRNELELRSVGDGATANGVSCFDLDVAASSGIRQHTAMFTMGVLQAHKSLPGQLVIKSLIKHLDHLLDAAVSDLPALISLIDTPDKAEESARWDQDSSHRKALADAMQNVRRALVVRYPRAPSIMADFVLPTSCYGNRLREAALRCGNTTLANVAGTTYSKPAHCGASFYNRNKNTFAYLWGISRAAELADWVLHVDDDFLLQPTAAGSGGTSGQWWLASHLARLRRLGQVNTNVLAFCFEGAASFADVVNCSSTPLGSCSCQGVVAGEDGQRTCTSYGAFCVLETQRLDDDTCSYTREGVGKGRPLLSTQAFFAPVARLQALWPLPIAPRVRLSEGGDLADKDELRLGIHIEFLYEAAAAATRLLPYFLDAFTAGVYKCNAETASSAPGGCQHTASLLSLGVPRGAARGYCEVTDDGVEGDCDRGSKGTWSLGRGVWGDGVHDLNSCMARCTRCPQCKYVSFSFMHKECSWFNSCDMKALHLDFGGDTYLTAAAVRDQREANVTVNGGTTASPWENMRGSPTRHVVDHTRTPRLPGDHSNAANATSSRSANANGHATCIKLFVYDLPDSYRQAPDGIDRLERGGHWAVELQDVAARLAGFPPGGTLFRTHQFSLGEIIYHRALHYHCRTLDPAEADLFFVPAFSAKLRDKPSLVCAETEEYDPSSSPRALFDRLRAVTVSGEAALDRRGGADHLLVQPRNGAVYEMRPMCELDYLNGLFGSAARVAVESPGNWKGFTEYRAYRTDVLFGAPFPSFVQLDDRAQGAPWSVPRERTTLAALICGVHGPEQTVRLRKKLLQLCGGTSGESSCTAARFDDNGKGKLRAETLSAELITAQLYWNATFCLQPTGDAVSRKGVIDSLLLGCIPVLFHQGQAEQWPWHMGAWVADASVLIDGEAVSSGDLNPLTVLAAIPAELVSKMQATIASHAHTLQYSVQDPHTLSRNLPSRMRHEDAFTVLLQKLMTRSHDPGLWKKGRAAQAAGRTLAQAKHAFASASLVHAHLRRGGCAPTDKDAFSEGDIVSEGDCERGEKGGWKVDLWGEATGSRGRLVSLADCERKCTTCSRCGYVSMSYVAGECSWFRSCDLSNLGVKLDDWQTVPVKVK